MKVQFTEDEKTEYLKLETAARDFYSRFRENRAHEITKSYLKISSKLIPLRVACAGGRYPIDAPELGNDNDDEHEEVQEKKSGGKSTQYSTFVFKSKFKVLLAALEKIRDEDPSSKSSDHTLYTALWMKTILTVISMIF